MYFIWPSSLLIWCLVYYRNHKLCILMSLSILFDNYSHHIDIHHLHGLLHCEFLNFVLMWFNNRPGVKGKRLRGLAVLPIFHKDPCWQKYRPYKDLFFFKYRPNTDPILTHLKKIQTSAVLHSVHRCRLWESAPSDAILLFCLAFVLI